jgi:hypothetical protein
MDFNLQISSAAEKALEPDSPNWRYSQQEREQFLLRLQKDGFCILPGHFSVEKLTVWQHAFAQILNERIANGTASGRGPNRYYISLPFEMPFADPAVFEDADILDILERAAEGDLVMPELAVDTPLQGSDYQLIHRDHAQRSPDLPHANPAKPFQFAVNFPLVDITLDNGPLEMVPGTHLLTDEECKSRIKTGEMDRLLTPLFMSLGDVMLRDVRTLHRGTPNQTQVPRPMVVVGYNRVEHRRPQLRIDIPQATQEHLSSRARQLLRLNPVVESLATATTEETYSNLYFLED